MRSDVKGLSALRARRPRAPGSCWADQALAISTPWPTARPRLRAGSDDGRPCDEGDHERRGGVAPAGPQGVKTGTQRDEESQQGKVARMSVKPGQVQREELVPQRKGSEQEHAGSHSQRQDQSIASGE